MSSKKIASYTILSIFILSILTILFVFGYSFGASPLTMNYPMDSTNFMVMGRMLLEGKIPYVDFFDHKGPSLILLEAIGQLIAPYRAGVLVLELFHIFFTLFFLWKTSKLLLGKIEALVAPTILLLFIKYVFSGGNNTEEYSLLYVSISLYFFCRLLFLNEEIRWKHSFVIGLCFAFVAWLRLNNALPIVAMCVFLFFHYLIQKDYKSLKAFVLYFVLGLIPFTLLYLIYFSYHGALYDLFYASFLFNFLYVKSYIGFKQYFLWCNVLSFIVLASGAVLFYHKDKSFKIPIFSLLLLIACTFASNIGGGGMDHYYINLGIVFVFGLITIFYGLPYCLLRTVLAISVSLLLIRVLYYGIEHRLFTRDTQIAKYSKKEKLYRTFYDLIPNEDKGAVYYYDMSPDIYPLLKISSNYKYFVLQEWMGSFDPHILAEINQQIKMKPPLWFMLASPYYTDRRYKNKEFVSILEENYVIRYEDNTYTLLMSKTKDKDNIYPLFKKKTKH